MKNYRLVTDDFIEASSQEGAGLELQLKNGSTTREKIFDDPQIAQAAFIEAKKELSAPKKLNSALYWFAGVMLESFEIDEDGEEVHPETEYIYIRGFDD